MAYQKPYPMIAYSVANYGPHFVSFWQMQFELSHCLLFQPQIFPFLNPFLPLISRNVGPHIINYIKYTPSSGTSPPLGRSPRAERNWGRNPRWKGGGGDSAYEKGGDARRKFWIKPLKETDLAWSKLFLTLKRDHVKTQTIYIFIFFRVIP